MLTICYVGQEFGQDTTGMVCVCSSVWGVSWKTQRLEVTRQLGAEVHRPAYSRVWQPKLVFDQDLCWGCQLNIYNMVPRTTIPRGSQAESVLPS